MLIISTRLDLEEGNVYDRRHEAPSIEEELEGETHFSWPPLLYSELHLTTLRPATLCRSFGSRPGNTKKQEL